MQLFHYVGPLEIYERAKSSPPGTPIVSRDDSLAWFAQNGKDEDGWATYVVGSDGCLLVAPRRSEHVSCASGLPVLAAGELHFEENGSIDEISNLSTGYCPNEGCWPEVRCALERAGLKHPDGFTSIAIFRRCPCCNNHSIVKDNWFVCPFCDSPLPVEWNFGLSEDKP
ncbi:MAG: hypothetical protein KDC10_11310 [Calditrichaeota bacterium]|nr:hypothetical protein [Calditrichota bacterium]